MTVLSSLCSAKLSLIIYLIWLSVISTLGFVPTSSPTLRARFGKNNSDKTFRSKLVRGVPLGLKKSISTLDAKISKILLGKKNGHDDSSSESQSIVLPIFPLRKSVRVPTDTLTLNLYEPRYLALCDYLLQRRMDDNTERKSDDNQMLGMFGACYCSSKSQVVRFCDFSSNSDNDEITELSSAVVTPMLEVGDVGVVCYVLDSEERKADTVQGRKISLKALAVKRFRITQILSNGFSTHPLMNDTNLPFVLVEADIFRDIVERNSQKLDEVMEEFNQVGRIMTESKKSSVKLALDVISSGDNHKDEDDWTNELTSFAALSSISNQLTVQDMEKLLKEKSTSERFEEVFAATRKLKW